MVLDKNIWSYKMDETCFLVGFVAFCWGSLRLLLLKSRFNIGGLRDEKIILKRVFFLDFKI